MTDTDRILSWLRDAMNAAQLAAEKAAALCGCHPPAPSWTFGDETTGGRILVGDDPHPEVKRKIGRRWNGSYEGLFMAEHIVRNDPDAVLRRIAADRQLLDDLLAERHDDSEEDVWYACAALMDDDGDPVCPDETRAPGLCDCGRDARVTRRVRLLAEAWGWTEAATKADEVETVLDDAAEIVAPEGGLPQLVPWWVVDSLWEAEREKMRQRKSPGYYYFNRPPANAERPHSPGCYEASWGWVHVKPGCHCPR
ncbi:DUF6221 family protein [Streptomyces sp. NPDC059928]|uniref:DUF6221 family protein n=1 Tax=unclassified Streptomyces TaxID=2593676 RepID=UPI003652BC84